MCAWRIYHHRRQRARQTKALSNSGTSTLCPVSWIILEKLNCIKNFTTSEKITFEGILTTFPFQRI